MQRKSAIEQQLEQTQQELAEQRIELQLLKQSSSYQLGHLLVNAVGSPRQLLSLPVALYRLFLVLRSARRPPQPDSVIYKKLQHEWSELARDACEQKKPLVFLFSGTTFIQGTRGNRPIRQTQALLRGDVRVLFSYYRSNFTYPLPAYTHAGLVQVPQDVTLQLLPEIAAAELTDVPKLFIVSYPYPGIEKSIELFRLHGWRIIYDCRDDWEEFSKVGMAVWFNAEVEKQLVQECDATICVSGPLVTKMQSFAPKKPVLLVPNAVETDFLPEDYIHQPFSEPKIIGYVGHLARAWFDWEALIAIAKARPNYSFEIIGHSEPKQLQLPNNINLLGPKPWNELHRYVRRWSVGIIPFKMGPLADGVDPIKIYEYFSFGLPVVSFTMPQIKDYPYTWTVDSVDGFCHALDQACITELDPSVIENFIARNTWDIRATQLISFMGNDLEVGSKP